MRGIGLQRESREDRVEGEAGAGPALAISSGTRCTSMSIGLFGKMASAGSATIVSTTDMLAASAMTPQTVCSVPQCLAGCGRGREAWRARHEVSEKEGGKREARSSPGGATCDRGPPEQVEGLPALLLPPPPSNALPVPQCR